MKAEAGAVPPRPVGSRCRSDAPKGVNHDSDCTGNVILDLMLPDAHYLPPQRAENCVDFLIPFAIPGDLRRPEFGACLRHRAVFRTAMPEASVDENSNFGRRKRNVRRPRKFLRQVKAIAETCRPQRPPEHEFRFGAHMPHSPHQPTSGRRGESVDHAENQIFSNTAAMRPTSFFTLR